MGILANLVSYNGTSIEWDASAVLGGLVTAVQLVFVCYIMIVGVRWFLRTMRSAPDPGDDDWDGPYEGQYSYVDMAAPNPISANGVGYWNGEEVYGSRQLSDGSYELTGPAGSPVISAAEHESLMLTGYGGSAAGWDMEAADREHDEGAFGRDMALTDYFATREGMYASDGGGESFGGGYRPSLAGPKGYLP